MEKAAGLPQISVQPYQHNSADTESLSWLHTGTSGGKKKASAALSPCVAGGAVLPLTPPLSADTHLSSSFDFAKLPAKSGKKSTPVPSIVGRECEREPAALLHTEKEPDSQQLRAEPPHPRPSLPDIDEMVRAHGESPTKPPYAIVCLVTMALGTAPNYKRTASEINDWVAARFAFYRNAPSRSWRFSLRHKLSVSSYFQRLEKNTHSKHKGCFWTIKPEHLEDVFKIVHKAARSTAKTTPPKKKSSSNTIHSPAAAGSSDESIEAGALSDPPSPSSSSSSLGQAPCLQSDMRPSTIFCYSAIAKGHSPSLDGEMMNQLLSKSAEITEKIKAAPWSLPLSLGTPPYSETTSSHSSTLGSAMARSDDSPLSSPASVRQAFACVVHGTSPSSPGALETLGAALEGLDKSSTRMHTLFHGTPSSPSASGGDATSRRGSDPPRPQPSLWPLSVFDSL